MSSCGFHVKVMLASLNELRSVSSAFIFWNRNRQDYFFLKCFIEFTSEFIWALTLGNVIISSVILKGVILFIFSIYPCVSVGTLYLSGNWLSKKSLSCFWIFVTPWTIQSMEFSRPDYWSGQLFPSPGDLPNPGIEHRSPTLQVIFLLAEPPGKPSFNLSYLICGYRDICNTLLLYF